jgi:pyridoxal phosphate enzyme (YggS family)
MPVNKETYQQLVIELTARNITLVAVSKTKPVSDIRELYDAGQRDFGENYVQELMEKALQLPQDIRWHFIGHLQSNKIRNIISFVHLIHGVDSIKLLKEINKQAEKINIVVNCLLQVHIAAEETKFGFNEDELEAVLKSEILTTLKNVSVKGFMGMASFTADTKMVRNEFHSLDQLFKKYQRSTDSFNRFTTLSMGMSNDYRIAMEEGSTLLRIGSLLFGERK